MTKKALKKLSLQEREAVQEFRNRVAGLLNRRLKTMKLFGSKARGDSAAGSDIDIFIVVDKRSPALEDQIIDVAFDVDLKYAVYISPRVVSADVLRNPIWKATAFLQNVAKEGVSL